MCCLDAIRCALEPKDLRRDPLSVHIALSFGNMSLGRLGGYNDDWIYLLNGPCLSALAPCIEDASSQQIVMTAEMYEIVCSTLRVEEVVEVEDTPSSNKRLLRLEVKDTYKSIFNRFAPFQDVGHLIDLSERFVPKPVRDSLSVFKEIGELRTVTTMFLKLDSYSIETNLDPTTLQPFFSMAQQALFENGGFMRQFLVDDKGCVLIGMWGVPSFSHANNALLALKCATVIYERCATVDHRCSIGITTGSVYCGTVGSVLRHDYVGIGGTVNLAARIMGKAGECILMDEATHSLLNKETKEVMVEGKKLILKGVIQPVQSYVYKGGAINVTTNNEAVSSFAVVRKDVAVALNSIIRWFNSNNCRSGDKDDTLSQISVTPRHKLGPGNFLPAIINTSKTFDRFPPDDVQLNEEVTFVIIEGEPGMGRSNAANYFRSTCEKHRLNCLTVQARHGDETVSYGVFKKIFFALVPPKFKSETAQKEILTDLLTNVIDEYDVEEELPGMLLKLKIFLGLNWSNDTSSIKQQVSSASKMDTFDENMISYFQKIMHKLMNDSHVAICIEDAQFCDELTWKQLEGIITNDVQVLIMVTMHVDSPQQSKKHMSSSKISPGFNTSGDKEIGATFEVSTDVQLKRQLLQSYIFLQICSTKKCRKLVLSPLTKDDIENILKVSLKSSNVSPQLVQTVFNVSSGNPFWITSVASFINERGAEEFTKAIDAKDANNPLHALILCRLDMLNPEVFYVAKIASIIGDDFTVDMICHLLPDVKNVMNCLVALKSNGFINSVENDPNSYEFQNPLLTSTIYELIPQQIQLENHLKIALYIEKTYASNLSPYYNR